MCPYACNWACRYISLTGWSGDSFGHSTHVGRLIGTERLMFETMFETSRGLTEASCFVVATKAALRSVGDFVGKRGRAGEDSCASLDAARIWWEHRGIGSGLYLAVRVSVGRLLDLRRSILVLHRLIATLDRLPGCLLTTQSGQAHGPASRAQTRRGFYGKVARDGRPL